MGEGSVRPNKAPLGWGAVLEYQGLFFQWCYIYMHLHIAQLDGYDIGRV